MPNLQRPEYLANGEAVLIDSDLLDKLRYGDPISGWEGDVNMNLWYNRNDDRIYLSSFDDNQQEYIICRSAPGARVADMNLLHLVVTHDRNKGFDLAKSMETTEAQVEKEKLDKFKDAHNEVANKLAWGVQKDLK